MVNEIYAILENQEAAACIVSIMTLTSTALGKTCCKSPSAQAQARPFLKIFRNIETEDVRDHGLVLANHFSEI